MLAGLVASGAIWVLGGAVLDPAAQSVAALATLMAVWWATEATDVAATALVPLLWLPIAGVSGFRDTAMSYAHPIVFLFMGGFAVALAIERSGLHVRIALRLLLAAGTQPGALVASTLGVAALLSMWVSNTSTALMLLPVVVSIAALVGAPEGDAMPHSASQADTRFSTALLLALAYGATLGGVATLIGTPPNALLAAFMQDQYGIAVGFAEWMVVGVPLLLVMLPVTWWILVRQAGLGARARGPDAVREGLQTRLRALGPISVAERRMAIVFALLVAAWLLRKPLVELTGATAVTDSGIAVAAMLAVLVLPSGRAPGDTLLRWHDTERLPWGVLILFGGGLALAAAMTASGLTAWMGDRLAPLAVFGPVPLLLATVALVVFLTELTSNTATAATFLPVAGAMSLSLEASAMALAAPVALAASFAFMLPVATPPNAVVYGSGEVEMRSMIRAGLWLNTLSIALLTLVAVVVVPRVFG